MNWSTRINPARATATIFGTLAGIGGILHGIGEIKQGRVVPEGIFIESWSTGPIAEHMGGDPALTIVPDMLTTGILATIISLAVIVWAVGYVRKKRGGAILLLLSVAMLLVGGGFGPPTLGILAGTAGLGIHAKYEWIGRHLPPALLRLVSASWPWIFSITVVNGVFLVIGHIILVFLFGVVNAELFLYSYFFAVVSLILTILAGIPYKIRYSTMYQPGNHR